MSLFIIIKRLWGGKCWCIMFRLPHFSLYGRLLGACAAILAPKFICLPIRDGKCEA